MRDRRRTTPTGAVTDDQPVSHEGPPVGYQVAAASDGAGRDAASQRRFNRRRLLVYGLGGIAAAAAAGATGLELVSHGILPGGQMLDQLDGACAVPSPVLTFAPLGASVSNEFDSQARKRTVGYTIAYPPKHGPGSTLPLVVMLHGFGGNHANAVVGMSPAQAVALQVGREPLEPMAMVTVDGGDGYWNPHPGDDPMAMVVDELIPLCQGLGLGRAPQRIGTMGISMGGYGALLLAEKCPHLIAAVAAISPAIWTSYAEARAANPGGVRLRSRLCRRRRSEARRRVGWHSGPGRIRKFRSLPPRRGSIGKGLGTRRGRRLLQGLPHQRLLHRSGAAIAGVSGPASQLVVRREESERRTSPSGELKRRRRKVSLSPILLVHAAAGPRESSGPPSGGFGSLRGYPGDVAHS
jgi:pimeloyl-ACP methyl ester carboxylesterase